MAIFKILEDLLKSNWEKEKPKVLECLQQFEDVMAKYKADGLKVPQRIINLHTELKDIYTVCEELHLNQPTRK